MNIHESAIHCQYSAAEPDFETNVIKTLLRLGVPANTKGFHYIKTAVLFGIENPIGMTSMSKAIYPAIAARYYIASTASIERAIRYAISQSCVRGDVEFIRQIFGYTDGFRHYSPTNREFLAVVSEYVKQHPAERLIAS